MKTVFMGTPEISAIILEEMIKAGIEVIAVVTQPDKPKGRGKEMGISEVKEVALKYDLPILQPVRARNEEFVAQIAELKPEMIVVVAFGQILPQSILDMPAHGCINIHASLLPKYRGAAPIQRVILDGEEKTGITIMKMDAGIDTGDMILKEEVIIEANETGGSLHDKLAATGAHAILAAIKQIEAGTATYEVQDDSLSCYAGKLTKELGNINFARPAVEIERLVRAMNPWPSAYTKLDGKTLKIWSCAVHDSAEDKKSYKEYLPGAIVQADKNSFYVKTSEGMLEILELQLEGKKRMNSSDFLRGYNVEIGTILG